MALIEPNSYVPRGLRICAPENIHGKQGRAMQFLGTKPKNCEGHLEHSMSPFRTQSNVRQLGGGARSQKCVCLTLNACTGFQQQLYQHPVPRGDGNKQGCGATLASVLERWRCLPSANNACPYHHKPTCPQPDPIQPNPPRFIPSRHDELQKTRVPIVQTSGPTHHNVPVPRGPSCTADARSLRSHATCLQGTSPASDSGRLPHAGAGRQQPCRKVSSTV